MIITSSKVVRSSNISNYCWSHLRNFHNVNYCLNLLKLLHRIPLIHEENARKQARQIRSCLSQAKEYFDASKSVSLATKPVLLYYSIMNFALAEILLKQSGDSSLDRARQQHRHHGLSEKFNSAITPNMHLRDSASALKAIPMISSNRGRFGTFELWHRTCRELPILGKWKDELLHQEGYSTVLFGSDDRLPEIPKSGLSLLYCYSNLPCMSSYLGMHDIPSRLIRAQCKRVRLTDNTHQITIVIHPNRAETLERFYSNVIFSPISFEKTDISEMPSGLLIRVDIPENSPNLFKLPLGTSYNMNDVYFCADHPPLTEFGFFYLALFILGTYARYYPDKWIRDIETASPLSIGAEILISQFDQRVPLLALSEMARELLVVE